MATKSMATMLANASPAATPGDSTPGPEEPVVIKMYNQHTKLGAGMPVSPCPANLHPNLRGHTNLCRHRNLLRHPNLRRHPNLHSLLPRR
eukprot:scaffold24580_cov39-Phaeocystis_antarctica.AAC.1